MWQLLRPTWREDTSAWGKSPGQRGGEGLERQRERERERESTSLLLWDYISLGLGWTRCFFQRSNQFPRLLQALQWVHPLVRLTGLFSQAPPAAPSPPAIWYWRGGGRSGKPLGGATLWSPGGWKAVASWWSKWAHAPLFVKLNV